MADILPFQQPRSDCRLLIAGPDGRTRDKLVADTAIAGFEVQACVDLPATAKHLAQIESDICLIDLDEATGDLNSFFATESSWRTSVALIGLASPELLKSTDVDLKGRLEIITKPCLPGRLMGRLKLVAEQLKLRQENERLQQRSRRRLFDEFVGNSDAAEQLRNEIIDAADSDLPLVVTGERGSGTSLVSRLVHLFGNRSECPLIAVDCSLQTSTALEQDLFGGMAGSFTASEGRLKQAAGGTLILENLDTVPLPMQKTLLSAIEQFVTGECPRADHVRVIAVMRETPDELVQQNQLLPKLAKLLSERTIAVPSLQQRREDVLPLAEYFLHRYTVQEGHPLRRLDYDARTLLTNYEWTGNVIQLWKVIQRAASVDSTGTLSAESLRVWLDDEATKSSSAVPGMTLRDMERKLIETTFNRCRGNREQTAHTLDIGLRTLSGKLREYGYPPRGGPGSNLKIAERKAA